LRHLTFAVPPLTGIKYAPLNSNRHKLLEVCGIEAMQNDIHKLIENAIYLHLSQLRYEVFTRSQSGGKEIDFVARKSDEVVYVQSCYLLVDEATKQREFGNLLSIHNNYPKYVVSLDEWTSGSVVSGIKHLHLGEFLKLDTL